MKTIYLLLSVLSAIGLPNDIIADREKQVAELRLSLKLDDEKKWSYGDSYGTVFFYRDADGKTERIVVKSSGGDYGEGETELFKVDGHLIYARILDNGWGGIEPTGYDMYERTYYFSPDSTGVSTFRKLQMEQAEIEEKDLKELRGSAAEETEIGGTEYQKLMDSFENYKTKEYIIEE